MNKHKIVIVLAVIIAFSLFMTGCGLLDFWTVEPESMTDSSDNLPEWLLLAHRSASEDLTTREVEILDEEDNDTDSDLAVGGSDEDDGIIAPSNQQATAQPTSEPESQPTGSNGNEGSAPTEESLNDGEPPKPGTKEYLAWVIDQRKIAEEEAKKAREEAEKAAKEEDDDDDDERKVWHDVFDN